MSDTKQRRINVFNRDSGICKWCNTFTEDWTIDHIEPVGLNVNKESWYNKLDNLQTLCRSCHNKKSIIDQARIQGFRTLVLGYFYEKRDWKAYKEKQEVRQQVITELKVNTVFRPSDSRIKPFEVKKPKILRRVYCTSPPKQPILGTCLECNTSLEIKPVSLIYNYCCKQCFLIRLENYLERCKSNPNSWTLQRACKFIG